MRGLGLFLIFLACGWMGFSAGESLERRLSALEQASKLLRLLEGELRCSCMPFPQAFRQVARRMPPPWEEYLKAMACRLEGMRGERLRQVWEEETDRLPRSLGLGGEDRQELAALGRELGYLDLTMQLRTLDHFLTGWDRRAEELRRELPARRKICRCLGVSAGLALVLTLL